MTKQKEQTSNHSQGEVKAKSVEAEQVRDSFRSLDIHNPTAEEFLKDKTWASIKLSDILNGGVKYALCKTNEAIDMVSKEDVLEALKLKEQTTNEIIEEVLNKFDKEKIKASTKETPHCYGWCFTYGEVKENILPYTLKLKEQEVRKEKINNWVKIMHIKSWDNLLIKERKQAKQETEERIREIIEKMGILSDFQKRELTKKIKEEE